MKSTTSLALVVGALIGVSPGLANANYMFQQGVNGYDGTHDTELRQSDPSGNFSSNGTMTVDGDDGPGYLDDVQALLRFGDIFGLGPDRIAYGSNIASATLRLYVTNPGDGVLMLQKLQGWDEGWTEWDDFGSDGVTNGNGQASYLRTLEGPPDGLLSDIGFIEIDVTDEVQLWSDNGAIENFGWAFLPTGNNGVDFAASEYGNVDDRPRLTVEVDQSGGVGEPFTLAVLGIGLAGLGLLRGRREP